VPFGECVTTVERKINLEWLNIALTCVTLVAIVGGWLWWGGRLSARVEQLEAFRATAENTAEIKRELDSKQSSDIAATSAQFNMIMTQLNRLESKVDTRR
jgi:uncharacterized protein involved in tolerance to divalent cations